MRKLCVIIISFLLLKLSLILCSLTETSCFWRIKANGENGNLWDDCEFFLFVNQTLQEEDFYDKVLDFRITNQKYEFVLVLLFATDEINRNPYLLPNMSLLFSVTAGMCFNTLRIIDLIISQKDSGQPLPNYVCGVPGCLVGVTGPSWTTSVKLVTFFHEPKVFFGRFHPILNDKVRFPYIYQIAHKDTCLPNAMMSLMLYFTWTWIGLVISNDDQGTQFLSDLREEMQINGLCLAFTNVIPDDIQLYMTRAVAYDKEIMTSSAKVVIIYGEMNSTLEASFRRWVYLGVQRIWITTSQWDVTTSKRDFSLDTFHGTVTFSHHNRVISKFRNFIQTMNTSKYPIDISQMRKKWNYFNCSVVNIIQSTMNHCSSNTSLEWLSQHEFDMVLSEEGYNLYNAVYAVAHTYHEIILQQIESQQIAELIGKFLDCQQVPTSTCSVTCPPGFRKFHQNQTADCCFDCVWCPENEVSNETDMETCVSCPDDQYANAEHTYCLQRQVSFLAYEDPLGMALACMSLCFSVLTALVLGAFVKYNDSPIVKANNRILSYILLISIIFCFLCSLCFIGHPNMGICILQQTTFGVFFTVALSTVLAKTITVVLAFKLTTPGRRMKRMLVSGAPNFVIPICTLIQLIIYGIWLVTSPPYVDTDIHSEHGQIVIVCNKGSVIAFHLVLGYLGSLALGSFTLAFLARNLPDRFNEAKFLTFSMLVFCSVWITFLPVYHSTKGKVMVAVEVFSILASSAGLLGCIFLPKCYVILMRPDSNSLRKYSNKSLY
ncbi:vomeronasal type-2 receptor 116-like isoform X8 [Meriones unguiculatus]|uniref:vomeronasal type-2 receptor 116-like isoform X8 n=1 Tax=Meriones unguiculatus TaxID=10047 RepID=UPI00293EE1F2|nr:vomeronasal type-2 receptor 116-like isoform X8 [Meriones unguiculatus]